MSAEEELQQTQVDLEAVSGQLDDVQRHRLADALRRSQVYAEELLHSALVIEELSDCTLSELDIALDAVRTKAEEVGLLQRGPLRAAPADQDGPSGT